MSAFSPEFRRTDQDRKPPRRVLTAQLLGDPPPDLEERRREAATRPPTKTVNRTIGKVVR